MTWEQVGIAALSFVTGVLGWILRELWDAVKELRRDVGALEVKVANDYLKSAAFDKAFERIMHALDEIRDAVARKEDRK